MSDEKPTAEAEAPKTRAEDPDDRQTDEAEDGAEDEMEEAEPHRQPGEPGRRRGRPSRARGRPLSSDDAAFRWTVRGVPGHVRGLALKAAEERGMTVGDWLAEAIVAFARSADRQQDRGGGAAREGRSNLPATDRPPDLVEMIQRIDARLTALEEQRGRRGVFRRLFGRRHEAEAG